MTVVPAEAVMLPYPVKIKQDTNGSLLVTFPDTPMKAARAVGKTVEIKIRNAKKPAHA